jgi:chromate reductase
MKIIALGASSSRHSINKELATYAAGQFHHAEVEVVDINDFPLPMYSIDLEREQGIPQNAALFTEKLTGADLLILSLAEHNGSYTAAFKNLFDWASRVKLRMFDGPKMWLLSAATGKGGGKAVMESAVKRFPKHGAEMLCTFSFPEFYHNYTPEHGIINAPLQTEFLKQVKLIQAELDKQFEIKQS